MLPVSSLYQPTSSPARRRNTKCRHQYPCHWLVVA